MAWTFQQTGTLIAPNGNRTPAYSGRGQYKNNPTYDELPNFGPIPKGVYRIGDPVDTVTHGPFVLPLTPDAANLMHGRSGFLIHGDSLVDPGNASEGCIVVDRLTRGEIAASGDRMLEVTAGPVMVAIDPGTENE